MTKEEIKTARDILVITAQKSWSLTERQSKDSRVLFIKALDEVECLQEILEEYRARYGKLNHVEQEEMK